MSHWDTTALGRVCSGFEGLTPLTCLFTVLRLQGRPGV